MGVRRDDRLMRRRVQGVRLAVAAVALGALVAWVATLLSGGVDPVEEASASAAMAAPAAPAQRGLAAAPEPLGAASASPGGRRPAARVTAVAAAAPGSPGLPQQAASGVDRCSMAGPIGALLLGNRRPINLGGDPEANLPLLQLADALLGGSEGERAVGMVLRDQVNHPFEFFRMVKQNGCLETAGQSDYGCLNNARMAVVEQRWDRLGGLTALALGSSDPAVLAIAAGALCQPRLLPEVTALRPFCQALATRWVRVAPDEAYPRLLLGSLTKDPHISRPDDESIRLASQAQVWNSPTNQADRVLGRSALFQTLDPWHGLAALEALDAIGASSGNEGHRSFAGWVASWCTVNATRATRDHQVPCQNFMRLMDNSPDAIKLVASRRRLGQALDIDKALISRLADEEAASRRLNWLPDPATLAQLHQRVDAECRETYADALEFMASHEARRNRAVLAARVGHTEAFHRSVAQSGQSVAQLAEVQRAKEQALPRSFGHKVP
jgi:hypothetical protein